MYPELLHLGPFVISSYGFMLVVAFVTCYILLSKDVKRLGWDPQIAQDIVFWAAIGGILGAKTYYIIENIGGAAGDNLSGLWNIIAGIFTLSPSRIAGGIQNFGAGLVFFGGLMGGMAAVSIVVLKAGKKWLASADLVAPYLILGYAIGRMGCFLVGDDYGTATSLPWGMAFPKGLPPTETAVHPTQIYEVFLGLTIFFVLLKIRPRLSIDGQLFSIYLMLAGAERFFIEFIRTNNRYLLGLTGAQIIGVSMFIIGGILLYQRAKVLKVPSS